MNKPLTTFVSLALMASTTLPALALAPTPVPPKTVNVACIQAAIDKRDTAVISAYDTLHTSIVAALNTRKEALKSAWAKTERIERRTALKNAWAAYHASRRSAQQAWRASRRTVWQTFRTEAKACSPTTTFDASNEASDITL